MRPGKRTQGLIAALSRAGTNVAVIVLFLGLSVFGGFLMRDVLLRNAHESNSALSRYYASETNSNLMTYRSLLELGIASVESRVASGESWEELEEWAELYCERLRAVLGVEFLNVYAVIDGRVLALGDWPESEDFDVTGRDWYRHAIESAGTPVFSDVYEDAITGSMIVTVSQYSPEANALLAFDLYPEGFKFQFSNLDLPEGTSFFLCDSSGVILYQQAGSVDPAQASGYLANLVEGIREGRFDDYDSSVVDIKGNTRAVSYTRLANGWLAIVTTPYSEILGDLVSVTGAFMTIALVFVLTALVMTLRDWRRTVQIRRSDDTVRVLGNSYFAIYLVNYVEETYEAIKGSDYVLAHAPESGPYVDLLDTISGLIEDEMREDFRSHFSAKSIAELVRRSAHEYGEDFLRRFGDEYRWVNVRVLHDEDFFADEVILCFREVDSEKRRQLQERQYLEQALASARSGMAARQSFFNNMSHDMRTPLNAIIGLTDLAEREEGLPSGTRRYLSRIRASGQQLLSLINDILDISQMEQGALTLAPERMSLGACVRDCVEPFELQACEQGKDLRVIVDVEDDCVMGDPVRLCQVLNNLLSNALKYTRPGDEVSLTVEQGRSGDVGSYRIVVADTGIGMTPEFLEHVFDVYSRERRFGMVKAMGTGLGMPITKNLVDQMGGDIRVESEPDRGTTVVVTLPFTVMRDGEAEVAAVPEGPVGRVEGLRVLVAEDNEVNMEIAVEMLAEAGVEVTPAWNGEEALELFRASEPRHFDAILMDMRMPVMDGCAAASAIRALDRPDAASVPIIAVTANAFAEDIVATTVAGMDAHVAKPIDFPELLRTLAELAGRHEGASDGEREGEGAQ